MKKFIALLLSVIMLVTLFTGCEKNDNNDDSQKDTATTGSFEAGYARVDVTPDEKNSMNLAGHGYERLSTSVWDPLYVTCTAIKDEEGATFLLYHCDFLKAYGVLILSKKQISKETGVPVDNILISTTHTHSAPGLDDDDSPIIEDYGKEVKAAMIKAAVDSIADLKPAKMFVADKTCDNMNSIRSVGVKTDRKNELDKTMELIKFVREGGKDIVLMNWQGHPRGHSEDMLAILSDVHAIRKCIEPALDCHFAFFLGASGNVNNSSDYTSYVDHYKHLTDLAVEAAAEFKEVEGGPIKKVSAKVEAEFKTGGGIDSVNVAVIAIGKSIAFVIVPYEMFSSSAKEIKQHSTFDQTFIVTCADNHYGYLPTIGTADDEYEVRVTNYAKGTAEMLVEGYCDLLDKLVAE